MTCVTWAQQRSSSGLVKSGVPHGVDIVLSYPLALSVLSPVHTGGVSRAAACVLTCSRRALQVIPRAAACCTCAERHGCGHAQCSGHCKHGRKARRNGDQSRRF